MLDDPHTLTTIPLTEHFAEEVTDAETLLCYAAEAGITIAPDIVEPILLGRLAQKAGVWTDAANAAFLAAYTRLSALLKPVSVASLKTPASVIAANVKCYRRWGVILTVIVMVLSLLNFVNSGIADRVSKDIDENNKTAVALRDQLGPSNVQYAETAELCTTKPGEPIPSSQGIPAVNELDTITQLQQFASVLRDIDSRAVKLNWFVFRTEARPSFTQAELQLDPQLSDFHKAAFCKIGVYEEVRNFAQNILADDTVLFGAISAYLLPVLYAVLGAFAYQIRLFTEQLRSRSFQDNRANPARIIAAVVAGSIVSLFNGFTQGATLSPLAIAFLVGYGVEIFYAFLDGIVATFASHGVAGPAPKTSAASVSK